MRINGIRAIAIKLGDQLYFQDSANGRNLFDGMAIFHAEVTTANGQKVATVVKVVDNSVDSLLVEVAA